MDAGLTVVSMPYIGTAVWRLFLGYFQTGVRNRFGGILPEYRAVRPVELSFVVQLYELFCLTVLSVRVVRFFHVRAEQSGNPLPESCGGFPLVVFYDLVGGDACLSVYQAQQKFSLADGEISQGFLKGVKQFVL